MDCQRISPLSWTSFYHGKGMEELRQSLLYTTLELEATRLTAQEEIQRREDQVSELQHLLSKAIIEKDEAEEKFQRLLMDKLILLQQPQQTQQATPLSGSSSVEDEPRRGVDSNNTISSSDCEESIVSSPTVDTILSSMVTEKPLPEKGKLLQAVMKAGPLLQILLLAGPLPQWQNPPPPLNSFEIPPVVIPSPPSSSPAQPHFVNHDLSTTINIMSNNSSCCSFNNKRRFTSSNEGSDSSTSSKYRRIALR